jgi:hypothetical protein
MYSKMQDQDPLKKIKFLWGYKSLNVVDICFSSTTFQIKDAEKKRYGVFA